MWCFCILVCTWLQCSHLKFLKAVLYRWQFKDQIVIKPVLVFSGMWRGLSIATKILKGSMDGLCKTEAPQHSWNCHHYIKAPKEKKANKPNIVSWFSIIILKPTCPDISKVTDLAAFYFSVLNFSQLRQTATHFSLVIAL